VNRRWPIAEVLDACRFYSDTTGKKVMFGWTLIAGKNDTPEHARQVAALLQGMNAHLNLIPLNLTEGYDGRTSDESAAAEFSSIIQRAGIPCTIRQRRGIDVAAGCGQLRSAKVKRRNE
jgi:23S rRNA (adenine2503-C2)-methyltransferase